MPVAPVFTWPPPMMLLENSISPNPLAVVSMKRIACAERRSSQEMLTAPKPYHAFDN